MKLLLCLLGLVFIVEGIPYFAFPERMKQWLNKVQETPDVQLRIIGFSSMCLGLVIVYLFR